MVTEIPVSKDQKIWVNIIGYNRSVSFESQPELASELETRLPELFGEDAHEFNVNRWLDHSGEKRSAQGVGVYANLLTFAHGPRACIGAYGLVGSTAQSLAY